ncbi:hypothetical protein EFP84_13570 [Leptospira kmetyi]|uniref:Uncharacterized protein n=1 Tax=Leptospira kmetyi TaxID=408139 RepID=A0AAD0UQ13_9LEPT|nr:hypothetical protein [Leptospira kmetyi]AYV56433.1 hypothetical protein EFP84_13570 [Leptospira kmetyi]
MKYKFVLIFFLVSCSFVQRQEICKKNQPGYALILGLNANKTAYIEGIGLEIEETFIDSDIFQTHDIVFEVNDCTFIGEVCRINLGRNGDLISWLGFKGKSYAHKVKLLRENRILTFVQNDPLKEIQIIEEPNTYILRKKDFKKFLYLNNLRFKEKEFKYNFLINEYSYHLKISDKKAEMVYYLPRVDLMKEQGHTVGYFKGERFLQINRKNLSLRKNIFIDYKNDLVSCEK